MECLETPESAVSGEIPHTPWTLLGLAQDAAFVRSFMRRVDSGEADACWPWRNKPDEDGYGRLLVCAPGFGKRGLKNVRAHRVAAALALPNYSDALVVRHSCDNPQCCNPNHLVMGTQADNIADRENRGRGKRSPGERNGRAILTEDQVREILASEERASVLGRRYGVHHYAITKIRLGLNWKCVSKPT
jgi:hypothetical protein